MKNLLRTAAIFVAATFCFITAAHAADSYFELNGFAFSINDEGKAVIRDYSGSDTDVVVPDKLLRATVTQIGDYAFYNAPVTSVDLQQATGLTRIGSYAFYDAALNELNLPANVELSFGSFQHCTALESLTVGDGIGTIPEQCFYNCSSLTEVSLPDSVTEIGIRAFGGCDLLRYVYLPDTVTSIAPNAFEDDDALIIRCSRDSYAAQYAEENGIRVQFPCTFLSGDADGDNEITIYDVTLIRRVLAQFEDDADGQITLRGSVSGGENLDMIDATTIQRFLAKMKISYPVNVTVEGYSFV